MSGALADAGHVSKYARDLDWLDRLPWLGPGQSRVAWLLKSMWDNALLHKRDFIEPGVAQLCKLAGVSRDTVKRAKAALVDVGLLVVEVRRHKGKDGLWWRQRDRLQVVVNAAVEALSDRKETGRSDEVPEPPAKPRRTDVYRRLMRKGLDASGIAAVQHALAAGLNKLPLRAHLTAPGSKVSDVKEARPAIAPALDLFERGETLADKLERLGRLREADEKRHRKDE